jgi:hypothetical protein
VKYLRLKKHRVRSDGVRSVLPVVIEKTRRFGRPVHEQKLSVRRDVLLTGAHQAGKSRWLARMHEDAPGIWKKRPALLIRCVNPLAHWIEQEPVKRFAETRFAKPWSKLRSWERTDALVDWVGANKPVLLVDDAQLLSGRKLDIALRLLAAAPLVVVTASEETRLAVSFRLALAKRNPQRIHLKSEAAYDITPFVVWMIVLSALAAGAWEISAAAAGLNLLGRGRRAARQT